MARLTPITSKNQVATKDQAMVDSIVASRGALQGPFTMFLHCPELAGRLAQLGPYVRFEGSLDVRVLAATTVARELEVVYVWGAPTGGARRLGVPESTITAIRENHSPGIPAEDTQIVDFTRQLMRKHRVDEATVTALIGRLGDDGFIQLTPRRRLDRPSRASSPPASAAARSSSLRTGRLFPTCRDPCRRGRDDRDDPCGSVRESRLPRGPSYECWRRRCSSPARRRARRNRQP